MSTHKKFSRSHNKDSLSPSHHNISSASAPVKSFSDPRIQYFSSFRGLLVQDLPSDIRNEETVQYIFRTWGDVRLLELDNLHKGVAIVHYFDLRNAEKAYKSMQDKSAEGLEGVQVHYTRREPDQNNGALYVKNVEMSVAPNQMKSLFEPFGEIRGIRCIATKRSRGITTHGFFIEYYDVRHAEEALKASKDLKVGDKALRVSYARSNYGNPKHTRKAELAPRVFHPQHTYEVTNDGYGVQWRWIPIQRVVTEYVAVPILKKYPRKRTDPARSVRIP